MNPIDEQAKALDRFFYRLFPQDEPCPHDEHDHGICLSCGKDITQDLVAKAEYAADAINER